LNRPTHKTVAVASKAEMSVQVGLIKKVLHCITRSKTIASTVNSMQIVSPISDQTETLY